MTIVSSVYKDPAAYVANYAKKSNRTLDYYLSVLDQFLCDMLRIVRNNEYSKILACNEIHRNVRECIIVYA